MVRVEESDKVDMEPTLLVVPIRKGKISRAAFRYPLFLMFHDCGTLNLSHVVWLLRWLGGVDRNGFFLVDE